MVLIDTFTVPAGQAANPPLTRTLELAHGIIHQVEVVYLDGPENEVNIIVRRALHQIMPTNRAGSVVGNNGTVRAILFHPLEEPPYEVQIDAWAPNASYDHEVVVRIHILPREILMPPMPQLGILDRIGRTLFGGGSNG